MTIQGALGEKPFCQNEYGDGLYSFDSKIKRYVFVGIVSYGANCGKETA